MSIAHNSQISQDKSTDYCKIQASESVPLDLYAIFSRSAYSEAKLDMATYESQKIERRSYRLWLRDSHKTKLRNDRNRVCLHINKNMIRIKVASAIQGLSVGGGKRSTVAGFSNKSRKRMIDLMNCQRHGAPDVFVSLTYADEALFTVSENETVKRESTSSDWKNHIEILRKRFERAYPDVLALWRIELKKRKSGDFVGLIAPHFHLLIWLRGSGIDINVSETCNGSPRTAECRETETDEIGLWLQKNWYEIVDTGLDKHFQHGTHVSAVKSARHAMFYVSKYVAKQEDDFEDNYEVGRRWGRIGKFDTQISVELVMGEKEYIQFRRLLRAWLKSKQRDYAKRIAKISLDKGFSIYGIGDGQEVGDDNFDIDLIMKFLLHAFELAVSIPIG